MTENNVKEGEEYDGLSVKKTMNNLPAKLQTSSVSFRVQLLMDLNEIVQPEYKDPESGIPTETIIKAICKVLPPTVLPRYKDPISRRSLLSLIESLVEGPCGAMAFNSLVEAMLDHFSAWGRIDFKVSSWMSCVMSQFKSTITFNFKK